jgi:hypothetical protein
MTIQDAAQTTGWSARMLRYIERTGLVTPARSTSGYRLYESAELSAGAAVTEYVDSREPRVEKYENEKLLAALG